MKASRIALATGPLRVLIPNLEERLKHASEASKSMLAKFKMSLVEGPAAIEKRQQRQIIAAGLVVAPALAQPDWTIWAPIAAAGAVAVWGFGRAARYLLSGH